jgi:hypothetical protein
MMFVDIRFIMIYEYNSIRLFKKMSMLKMNKNGKQATHTPGRSKVNKTKIMTPTMPVTLISLSSTFVEPYSSRVR